MTDPWYTGANQHREQQQRQAEQEANLKRQKEATRLAEQEAATIAGQEMKQSITAAVPLLTHFLHERGAAAQALLGSTSQTGSYIVFGDEREGGYYFSVSLDKSGLVREEGRKSGYDHVPTTRRLASPEEAVDAFAYYGPGRKNPQQVRDIVDWLTKQVNAHLPR